MACFRFFITPMTYLVIPKWDVELVLRAIPKCVLLSPSIDATHIFFILIL
jgi:hypothetical protein